MGDRASLENADYKNTYMLYIANICLPRNPKISRMSTIVSVDKNNNSKIVVENCKK